MSITPVLGTNATRMSIKRRKKSEEEIVQNKADRERMLNLFSEIWLERPHYSILSGKWLGNEPMTTFFDHLLEKSVYPQFKYEKENIILVTPDEHTVKTNGFPLPKHQELIEVARKKFL